MKNLKQSTPSDCLSRVIDLVDDYGWNRGFLINVGDVKLGYSCVTLGSRNSSFLQLIRVEAGQTCEIYVKKDGNESRKACPAEEGEGCRGCPSGSGEGRCARQETCLRFKRRSRLVDLVGSLITR